MDEQIDLDARIRTLTNFFDTEDVILGGGLAAFLNTGIYRQTDDVDLVGVSKSGLGNKKAQFQRETGFHVDITQLDYVFDSINLSDEDLMKRSTRIKNYDSGESLLFLGAEAVVATKLTSFCVSGDPNLPSRYGIKVLRDKDLQDIRNLRKSENFDEDLLYDLLGTVPQLEEVEDPAIFWGYAKRVMSEPDVSPTFTKNAFGIARYLAVIPEVKRESEYQSLKEMSDRVQLLRFAEYVEDDKFLNAYE